MQGVGQRVFASCSASALFVALGAHGCGLTVEGQTSAADADATDDAAGLGRDAFSLHGNTSIDAHADDADASTIEDGSTGLVDARVPDASSSNCTVLTATAFDSTLLPPNGWGQQLNRGQINRLQERNGSLRATVTMSGDSYATINKSVSIGAGTVHLRYATRLGAAKTTPFYYEPGCALTLSSGSVAAEIRLERNLGSGLRLGCLNLPNSEKASLTPIDETWLDVDLRATVVANQVKVTAVVGADNATIECPWQATGQPTMATLRCGIKYAEIESYTTDVDDIVLELCK